MQSKEEDAVRTKMESLLAIRDREFPINDEKMESFTASFRQSLESIKIKAQENVQNQAKLVKIKADLREAEDEFMKVLAVKTRKKAKKMATRDSISATKARLEELKRKMEVQRARRDEYAAIIYQQSLALATPAEKTKKDHERKGQIQEVISWYNGVLGFHVEGGQGLSFQSTTLHQDSCTSTVSAPAFSVSNCRCDSPANSNEYQIQHGELNRQVKELINGSEPLTKKNQHNIQLGEVNRQSKKPNHGRRVNPTLLSPGSASTPRRSARIMAKK